MSDREDKAVMTMRDDIQPCHVCGLPTFVGFKAVFCTKCKKLLCVTCQEDGHECYEGEKSA